MEFDEETPLLLRFYFGEAAGRAKKGASRRLRRWARAFEAWMGECEQAPKPFSLGLIIMGVNPVAVDSVCTPLD